MIYGVSGSSGSGKTTLAKKVAEELGFEFFPASITELGKEIGLDPVHQMTLETRIGFQAKLLEALVSKIRALDHKKNYIMDRTPLDTVGYLMGELDMHSGRQVPQETLEKANSLVDIAQTATASYFDGIWITAPLSTYEEVETRPKVNPAYQRGVHLTIIGAAFSSNRVINFEVLNVEDLDARVEWMTSQIKGRVQDLTEMKRTSSRLH